MSWSIGATGTKVSSRRRVTSVWTKLAPGGYEVMKSPNWLNMWCHPVKVNLLPLYMSSALSLVGACGREVERVKLVGDCDACGQRKILKLNVNSLN